MGYIFIFHNRSVICFYRTRPRFCGRQKGSKAMKKILILSLICLIAFSSCFSQIIERDNKTSIASSEDSSSSDTDSDLFPKCSEEETKAFVETEEAFINAHMFAWNHPRFQFESAEALKDSSKAAFLFGHIDDLMETLGHDYYDEEGLRVPLEIVNELLFKYYGIETFDPILADQFFADGEIGLPVIREYSNWDIDYLNIEKIDGNTVTYKYCFHYGIFDDLPGPFQTSYMTVEALKDGDQIFFRLISQYGLSEEFDSIN